MNDREAIRKRLSAAHADALRVHDSPVRADPLADTLERLSIDADSADLGEEQLARLKSAVADAVRVLRRDDDGREAARHLQTAMRQLEPRTPRKSPFLEDLQENDFSGDVTGGTEFGS